MARVSDEREIDGFRYLVQQLPAGQGMKLLMDVGKVLGPALAALTGGESTSVESFLDRDLSKLRLDVVAKALFDDMDSDFVLSIINRLGGSSWVFIADEGGGTPRKKQLTGPVFDVHFQGRLMAMLKWAKFSLEVQFGDFFGGITGLAAAPQPQAA